MSMMFGHTSDEMPAAARSLKKKLLWIPLIGASLPLGVDARAADTADATSPIYVGFSYEAEGACPNEDYAFSLVHRRSRRVLRASGPTPEQALSMRVQASSSGYRGVLAVKRANMPEEKRTMTGARCDEVVEALALTAALSIDPEATLTLGPAEPTSNSTEDTHGIGPVDENAGDPTEGDETSTSPIDSHGPLRAQFGPVLSLQKVTDHNAHFGLGAHFGVSRDSSATWFPLELRVAFDYLFAAERDASPEIVTRFFVTRISYCAFRVGGDSALLLCPVVQAGAVQARADGFEGGTKTTRSYSALGAEAWFRSRLSEHAELWLAPALLAPLTRREFAVDPGPEVLASTLRLSWTLSAGLGFRL